MKKLFFETEKDGFYGTYYENPKGSDCAVIGLFGDDPNDYMAKCGANGFIKMVSMSFVCRRERKITAM